MKEIGLSLVRATEHAAIEASKLIGSGQKERIDKVASLAIEERLNELEFCAKIVMSEGEKDSSFYLKEGTLLGKFAKEVQTSYGSAADNYLQKPKQYSLILDSVDGTTQTSIGGNGAISVMALAEEDSFYTTSSFYMKKLVYGPKLINELNGHYLSLNQDFFSLLENLHRYTHRPYNSFTICMLNRERHAEEIKLCREFGVRLRLISDCDIGAAIATCLDSGIDAYIGIGGASEALLAAAAVKCLDGYFEAAPVDKEWKMTADPLTLNELIKSNCVFVATGITNSELLQGVKRVGNKYHTESVFMRSQSGTIRKIFTEHGN